MTRPHSSLERLLLAAAILALLLGLSFAAAAAGPSDNNEVPVQSAIDHVVVYEQGAQIERLASVTLQSGINVLVFKDLNTAIDPSKVRLSGHGDFTVLGISHRYHTDTLGGADSHDERMRMTELRNKLTRNIQYAQARRVLFDREEQLLLQNQDFKVKDTGVDLDRLMLATAFFQERFQLIQEGRAEIDREVASLQAEIVALDLAMQQLPTLRTATSLEVMVRVESAKSTQGELVFSYWMQQAGWTPSYNVRVKDIDDPMRLECQAMVHQTTGERWEDVTLTVATGTPSQNRSKPNLQPWYIDGSQGRAGGATSVSSANAWLKAQPYNPTVREVRGQLYDANGLPLVGATVMSSDGRNRAVTDINGFYNLQVAQGTTALSYQSVGYAVETMNISSPVMNVSLAPAMALLEVVAIAEDATDESESLFGRASSRRREVEEDLSFVAVDIAHSPTQTRFNVAATYDIPSDGHPHAVRIQDHNLEADYLHQCAPKLDPQVYLTAMFTDWESLDLMNGRMHVYFGDDYVGESQLRLDFVEDTLAISLGPDPNIVVRRKRTLREDKIGAFTGKKEFNREYTFTVINRKKSDIHLQLEDQLPLVRTDEIVIDRLKLDGATVHEASGQVVWDMDVKAGDTEERKLRYVIQSPRELMVLAD
ncbi:MAG: mucoidy inhibitor MuiA family protein [Bacteroidetes bacterium]|nr:mucoidy inhibitor MuiA family protein [Bacteroidota bacterium]